MPFNTNKHRSKLDGGEIIFIGILTVLGLLCIAVTILLYAEVIQNNCSL